MSSAITSSLLLLVTILALLAIRKREIGIQVGVEAAFLVAIGGFLMWHRAAPLFKGATFPPGFFGTWLRALAIIWWLIAARFVANIAVIAQGLDPKSRGVRLFSDLTAAVIYISAVLVIVDSVFDLPVKGLLATSGIVAIVIGLALQNTLADVFAGIAVGMEKPFHVGDRVSIGNDSEGVLVQINWRSIRIRTDGDDLATIPNSVVARGHIVNRSVPTARRSSAIEIKAAADAPRMKCLS